MGRNRKAFNDFILVTKGLFLLPSGRHALLSCRSPGGLCDQSDLHYSPYQGGRICPHFTFIPSSPISLSEEGPSGWAESGVRVSSGVFPSFLFSFVLILIVSRQECVMHGDGAEEVPDEVENVCSNDGKLLKTQRGQSVNPACVIWPCVLFRWFRLFLPFLSVRHPTVWVRFMTEYFLVSNFWLTWETFPWIALTGSAVPLWSAPKWLLTSCGLHLCRSISVHCWKEAECSRPWWKGLLHCSA